MSSIDEISRAIGALQASVTHLAGLVARNTEVTDDLRDDVGKLQAGVTAVNNDMAAIKISVGLMQPVVKKIEKWEQRIIGVSAVVSAVITVVGTGILAKLKGWMA